MIKISGYNIHMKNISCLEKHRYIRTYVLHRYVCIIYTRYQLLPNWSLKKITQSPNFSCLISQSLWMILLTQTVIERGSGA